VILAKEEIVLASNNLHKVREINTLLRNTAFQIVPQSKFDVIEADETGVTFLENALIKARNAAEYTQHPIIADDSGIEVYALEGRPGIFSSRYAGLDANDEDNLNKLIENINGLDPKDCHARFICSMVFLENMNEKDPIVVEGVWEGYVVANPRGKNGFGYDPIFYIPSLSCTSAELSDDKKNELSHRGQALRLLIKKITGK